MGQRWSMLKNGYLEESEYEEGSESTIQLQQRRAATEASSSVAAFDNGGLSSKCPNDMKIDDAMVVAFLDRLFKFEILLNRNLSNLQSGVATVDARRGTTTPLSSSHFSSLQGSEAPYTLRPRRIALDYNFEAYREAWRGQFAIRKLGATARPADAAKLMKVTGNEPGEVKRQPCQPKPEGQVMVGKKRKLVQSLLSPPPFSPAQTLMMFQVDPKRNRSAGVPSLAFDYAGSPPNYMKEKPRVPPDRQSEVTIAKEVVLDLGTSDAMVERSVKKVMGGQRLCRKGYVSCYNVAQHLYQVKYGDGEEEALEWLDLEPCPIVKGRARMRPKFKNVDELVYSKRKRPGTQGRRNILGCYNQ